MTHVPDECACVSFETALILLGVSRRTLWRRLGEGAMRRGKDDARGRTMLVADDVLMMLGIPAGVCAPELLAQADAGDTAAQNELGMALDEAGDVKSAIHWWTVAAESGESDSMQLLGRCYAAGRGVPKDEHLATMWLSRAAANGHEIARSQMQALLRPHLAST